MSKLEFLKIALQNIINSIDAGTSLINEDQCDEVFEIINRMTNPEYRYSKYKACEYLGISRATLDNYVREGKVNVRIKSEGGFNEKYFLKKDLDELKKYIELNHETRGRKKKDEYNK